MTEPFENSDRDILLNAIMDGGKHAIAVGDRDRVIKIVNKTFERMYGYDSSYFVGRHLKDLIQEIHLQSELEEEAKKLSVEFKRPINYREVFDVHLKDKGFLEHEWTVIRGDGTHISVWLTISTMRDVNGEIYGYLGIAQDITERKSMEQEIQRHAILLSAVMDGGKHGIILSDRNRAVLFLNGAGERMCGYKATQFLGGKISSFVNRVLDRTELLEEAERLGREFGQKIAVDDLFLFAIQKFGTYEREWTSWRSDGSKIPVILTVTAMKDLNGEFYGSIGIFQDISERKEIDRIKSEFISTASHELRTPLTSIRAAVGLVATGSLGSLSGKARDVLNIAYKNCERLVRIINDILDVERIESGRLTIDSRALWVSEMLPQALEANRGFGEKYGVRFVLKNVPRDVKIMADPDRLMQVMANLISNAAKFSSSGAEVWLGAQCRDDLVSFSVRDFGAGIPEPFRPHIFQKFAQSDHSDARHNEGTGLGLSIAQKLVEAMHGSIRFETETGRGTTFFFDLPKAD